jgi:thioester reductase-like protein
MNVLITGASGLLGTEVAQRLVASGAHVVALTHSRGELLLNNGRALPARPYQSAVQSGVVHLLRGDLTAPLLGLPRSVYQQLARSTDLIIHSAALTEFGRPFEDYQRINIEGTRAVVDFALALEKIPLVHISTAYVCGKREGLIPEDYPSEAPTFGNPYEQSKYLGEGVVRGAAERGLKFLVMRPSIVVGAGSTGRIREFKNIYLLLKALTSGRVSAIPGNYNATLDLVPLDYVAKAVTRAALTFDMQVGRTFQLVGRVPMTLRDFSDVLAEFPSMRVPRFIPPHAFSCDGLSTIERRTYRRIVRHYDSYFVRELWFSNTNTLGLMGGEAAPYGRSFLRKIINYCEQVGFLGAEADQVYEPALSALPN